MIKVSISIDVSNLKQAESFYTKALGCKKVRDQGAGMSVLSTQNVDIYLQEKEAKTKPLRKDKATRDYNRHWTPVHLDFICDNVDEIVVKIVKYGGLYEGGDKGDWGSIAYCADPFGNGFCVINE
jgi:predicted enzyme related to lactoylglutathione lyase